MFFADDHDHDDDNNDNQQVDHQTVHVFLKMNVNQEKHLVVRTSTRKRKRTFKAMFMEVETVITIPLNPQKEGSGASLLENLKSGPNQSQK
ncbi:hypothetical protein HanHA300_Chr02g0040791 [Helianthus annuus]|nr:hypothetical protein HanHA300_Chr02g0040791 [Helianthus annuus]KAJ0617634.1 hypothetical protein HanHA89_Chr02g0044011 [Helianthus annuus]KAJ0776173.1 hypothetical protein HanLR1_Chr02g0042571 [Helianthus annuus]